MAKETRKSGSREAAAKGRKPVKRSTKSKKQPRRKGTTKKRLVSKRPVSKRPVKKSAGKKAVGKKAAVKNPARPAKPTAAVKPTRRAGSLPDGLALLQPRRTRALMAALGPTTFNALGSPFSAPYPNQIEGWLPGYAGETRGFYRDLWKPSWSRFGAPRNGPPPHGGVDIYAPVGTEVVAVVDGELSFIPDNGDEIGNRAWLVFSSGGTEYKLVYGHLLEFHGANRSVAQGAKIGRTGCSGNAGDDPSCMGQNKCGKSSSHLHLQLMVGATKIDPLAPLGWTLRYYDDDRVVSCSAVT